MKKYANTYQEYNNPQGTLVREYGFPSENAAIALELIEEKFHGNLPEIEKKPDGEVCVKLTAGDSRFLDLQELVSGPFMQRVRKRDGLV